jgi:hypothetical protein
MDTRMNAKSFPSIQSSSRPLLRTITTISIWQGDTFWLENGCVASHIHAMRIKLSILLAAALLAAAILLVFRDEIHARNELVPQCGFWGDVEAGMSCR